MATPATLRLLDADTTAAVILGASDWTGIGLGKAPSFRGSAKGIYDYLTDKTGGLGLNFELVLDLFNDTASAGDQLERLSEDLDQMLRERRETGRPIEDVLIYYVGHGITDKQGSLNLLVRRSRKGHETTTGIKAADLAETLKNSAPQQRRLVVLDCCFSEAAARAFISMGALEQAVAATTAKDLTQELPRRGGLLLCSSLVDDPSIGIPDDKYTLFTGAVIELLRAGIEGQPPLLSFADLCELAYNSMLDKFGIKTPRPALHPFNQTKGDLSRLPAFPNRAAWRTPEEIARLEREAAVREPIARAQKHREEEDRRAAEEATRSAKLAAEREAVAKAQNDKGDAALGQKNYAAALKFYQQAADMRNASAQCNIGFLYHNGLGVPQDYKQAMQWYQKAAEQGDADAQNNIGFLYRNGYGVPQDYKQAMQWFQKAADQGNSTAQYNIGVLYLNGWGVPKDKGKARPWMIKAASGGSANAEQWLANNP